jgi:hypothetical protein
MSKIIYVFCGLDLHKNTMQHCISTLLKVRDDVDVGVATYGNSKLPPSVELSNMCQEMGIPFHDCPRQSFSKAPLQPMLTNPSLPADVDSCELTGMIQISHHFYKNYDYDMVILMHPDCVTIRNHNNTIEKYLGQDYCLIAPLINLEPNKPPENLEMFDDMTGLQISKTRFRIAQAILSFGKNYCLELFEKYETPEAIWSQAFAGYVKWGDCSAINLYPSHEGYKTILLHNDTQIVSQQSFEEHTLENLDYESFLKKHKKFNFVHIGHAPPSWRPERNSPGRFFKEKYIYWVAAVASRVRKNELGE